MFSLKNLFAGNSESLARESRPAAVVQPAGEAAMLCRSAILDRHDQLAGHFFHMHRSSPLADAPETEQRRIDQQLLTLLGASQEAWNTQPAFISLNSSTLDSDAVERLPANRLVLFIRLSTAGTNPKLLGARLADLRQRGLGIGLFHQPWHPDFSHVRRYANHGLIDVAASDAEGIRDFPATFGQYAEQPAVRFLAANIDALDELRLCRQRQFDLFHGRFTTSPPPSQVAEVDPHKAQLLNLLRLVQGEAQTPEIAEALKQAPILSFRIFRYLNSPALGLNHRIDSINQALIMLGRQRLTRWLSVLLFSVGGAGFADWLLVESALTRASLMEKLGPLMSPKLAPDPLFLTGMFSCLDRLLHRPLGEILQELPLADDIRRALLEKAGPYAALLAVAEASEACDAKAWQGALLTAGLEAESANHALLAATAWASEVTEHWE